MKKLKFILSQRNPILFLLSYCLWKTGFSRLITFKIRDVKIKFYKSNLLLNLFANRNYIDQDLNLIFKHLKKGDTFIDIGANVGTWTLFASKIVGSNGKVLSFEPHPRFFKFLCGNINENRFKNINAFNVGLSYEDGNLNFSKNYDTMNHITDSTINSIIIPVNQLDSFTKAIPYIDLIKIDVEGYELNVFKGAVNTLKKTNKIIFESNEVFQKRYNYKTSEMISFLNNIGFKIYISSSFDELIEINNSYSSFKGEDLLAIKY